MGKKKVLAHILGTKKQRPGSHVGPHVRHQKKTWLTWAPKKNLAHMLGPPKKDLTCMLELMLGTKIKDLAHMLGPTLNTKKDPAHKLGTKKKTWFLS